MSPADSVLAAVPPRPRDFSRGTGSRGLKAFSIVGLLLLATLTLAHPSATRMHTWPWAFFAALLWLIPIALASMRVATGAVDRLPPPLVLTALLLLAVSAVASAWLSPFSGASLARVWPTLGGVALYCLIHDWLARGAGGEENRPQCLARIISVAGAVMVGVSLVGWLLESPSWPWAVRNTIPFGHSNYTAGLIVLVLPWFLLRAWQTLGLIRLGWSAIIVGTLFALSGTSSRGAVLALAAVASAGAAVALVFAPWPRSRKAMLAGGALIVALGSIFANPRLRELALNRTWSDGARESNRQRSAMLSAGARLGAAHPWLGWGPGTVPLVYPKVRSALDGGVEDVLQLHNTPVQIWSTLGGFGALASVLLVSGLAVAVRRAGRAIVESPPVGAALASLAGYGLFALTDHQFDLPIVVALTAASLAMVTAAAPSVHTWSPARAVRLALTLGAAVLLAGPIWSSSRDLRARRAYEQGLVALESGREADFVAALDRATQLTPYDPYFLHQVAGSLLRARDATDDPARRLALTRIAVARLEASLSTGVFAEFAHFNLGWLQLELGDHAAAVRHFTAAARLVPDKGGVYFGLGLACQAAGRRDDAVRAFALEGINDPRSLTSPAWEISALATLRPLVQTEMIRLYAKLAPSYPASVTVAVWTRWWFEEPFKTADPRIGFSRESTAFAAALPAINAKSQIIPDAPWAVLYDGWRLQKFDRAAAGDATLAAALARRANRHRESFRDFLTAGTEDEAALLRTLRRQRTGYGVLALHPDGPVLSDVYIVQENRVVTDFAAGLFPPKGWIPGRFLLALLPPDSR